MFINILYQFFLGVNMVKIRIMHAGTIIWFDFKNYIFIMFLLLPFFAFRVYNRIVKNFRKDEPL